MTKTKSAFLALLAVLLSPMAAYADIIFTFEEVGGNVTMTSSGVLDTSNLILVPTAFWGGTGTEENGVYDIMGSTDIFGQVDVTFGFSDGTDYSAWASANGPWSATTGFFGVWDVSGSTSFNTYSRGDDGSDFLPGISMVAADIVNDLWTPDNNWLISGQSFASLNMFEGTYAVSDALTGETITIQIGAVAVPEPGIHALFGIGLLGMAAVGRRRKV